MSFDTFGRPGHEWGDWRLGDVLELMSNLGNLLGAPTRVRRLSIAGGGDRSVPSVCVIVEDEDELQRVLERFADDGLETRFEDSLFAPAYEVMLGEISVQLWHADELVIDE